MIFLERDGTHINTLPNNPYYEKVLKFKKAWESGQETFEVHTSGSTGTPKKITLHRKQMIDSVKMTAKAFDLEEGDTAFCCLNIDYIAGMMMLVRAFEIGMDLVVVEPSSNPFETIEKHLYILKSNRGRNFFAFVPLQIQTLLESKPIFTEILNSAKAIIIGGAAVNEHILEKVQMLFPPVYVTYGMTETITHVAIKRINGSEKDDFFNTLDGVDIQLNDENCLMIKSKTTNNEWITTNDVAEIINGSSFILHGRIDNVINSGGVKIQLEKIDKVAELVLKRIQEPEKVLNRYFVFSLPDEKLGERLIFVLEKEPNKQFPSKDDALKVDILQAFKEILPKFEAPKEVFFVEKLIETPTGKIDKIKTINAYVLPQISNG
ncbi:AMP-dependent synthetase and ligase [Emticicia oligotrophica DSM 17448]|uniref:AMP-dependent synthetase and ligase n=1 Tax=Emticicia oligotrophica (strain DSM 17448 / CIP 109782 / MTCC 6937 / GPTSA100-15) TaxID=929562 RepID=A0ABM5N6Q9_EMTOG|nr:AMP-binding protein [Emticicia oligotrophica]AFK05130.1 AMP-dependent synthetase and ligase [Emticicia oligotrophica DSM 17448]